MLAPCLASLQSGRGLVVESADGTKGDGKSPQRRAVCPSGQGAGALPLAKDFRLPRWSEPVLSPVTAAVGFGHRANCFIERQDSQVQPPEVPQHTRDLPEPAWACRNPARLAYAAQWLQDDRPLTWGRTSFLFRAVKPCSA